MVPPGTVPGNAASVAASGFYEWHVNADGSKTPFYITCVDQPIFGFAALWDAAANAATNGNGRYDSRMVFVILAPARCAAEADRVNRPPVWNSDFEHRDISLSESAGVREPRKGRAPSKASDNKNR